MVEGTTQDVTRLKTCTTCYKPKPIGEFRRRWKNSDRRHSQCRDCYNREQKARKQARRRKQVCNYMKHVVDAKRDMRKVIALTARLFHQLQRVDHIAHIWKQAFDEARQKGRHSIAMRHLLGLMELMAVSERLEVLQQRDIERMTDEELEAKLRELQVLGVEDVLRDRFKPKDEEEDWE